MKRIIVPMTALFLTLTCQAGAAQVRDIFDQGTGPTIPTQQAPIAPTIPCQRGFVWGDILGQGGCPDDGVPPSQERHPEDEWLEWAAG